MTTEAQRTANALNGAKSRGPVTPEGKAVARLNAMKHGIYSERVLIQGESEADLIAFGKRMRATLAPVGELELMLADKIVATSWRLRRLAAAEAALFNSEAAPAGNQMVRVFGGYNGDRLMRLGRLEAGLERALYKAMHELQRLQGVRGEATPASVAVDVTVSSSLDDTDDVAPPLGSFLQNGSGNQTNHNTGEGPQTLAFMPIGTTRLANDLGETGATHGRPG